MWQIPSFESADMILTFHSLANKGRLPLTKDRNKDIVWMIDENRMTKTAVAKRYNISKQRVQQIYKREKEKNVQDIRSTGNGQNDNAS